MSEERAQALHEAHIHESALAEQAAQIRGDATELTPSLFLELWPLLYAPIPVAYIQSIPAVKGKPYESTGIRSVQVQIDRMNNVLTPLGWRDYADYEQDGRLCTVSVYVIGRPGSGLEGDVLLSRSSRGGVNQGSTVGNVYKGSYTSAAKRAFAAIGPGHEVYLGTADLDPDVNAAVAGEAAEPQLVVGTAIAKQVVDRAWVVEPVKSRLQLGIVRLTGEDPGDVSTKAKAVKVIAKLTPTEVQRIDDWIAEKAKGSK